ARRIAMGDLTKPIVVQGSNELSALAITFDSMRSSLLEAHKHLEHQARHDALTGLPNRLHFHENLRMALDSAQESDGIVALLYIDCDNFKTINDTLGHDAGDAFLKQRADCMSRCLRPHDTLARLGGDEFAAILTKLNDFRESELIG